MIFDLSLFLFGFILACALIARKMWFLRTGKIVAGSYEEADWTELSVESIRLYALEIIKIAVHRIILTSLKIWILFTHFIRRADRRIRAKLMHMIHKNAQYNADTAQKPSEFLSDIKEHKDKMLESVQKEDQ